MEATEVQRYEALLKTTVLPWLEQTDKDLHWQLHSGTDETDGVIYRAHVPKYGTIWKAQVIMECTAETGHRAIVKERNTSWMPNLSCNKVLDSGENWEVCYQIAKGVAGISDRDFLTIRHHGKIEDDFYVAMSCSIPNQNYDIVQPKKCVRGETHPSGFSWKQLDGKRCLFTYIYNVDLKGYLPKSLINMTVANFLLQFVVSARNFSKSIEEGQDVSHPTHGHCNKEKENKSSHEASSKKSSSHHHHHGHHLLVEQSS